VEWLCDVVVRSELEADHPIDHVTLAGDHHDGNLMMASDIPREIESIFTAEHQVKRHEIDVSGREQGMHGGAVGRFAHAEPFRLKAIAQQCAHGGIVVNHKNVL
jgi:hypothetical protein